MANLAVRCSPHVFCFRPPIHSLPETLSVVEVFFLDTVGRLVFASSWFCEFGSRRWLMPLPDIPLAQGLQVVGCPLNVIHSLAGPVPGLCAGDAEKAPYEVRRRGGETSAHAGVRTALDCLRTPPTGSAPGASTATNAPTGGSASSPGGSSPGQSSKCARNTACGPIRWTASWPGASRPPGAGGSHRGPSWARGRGGFLRDYASIGTAIRSRATQTPSLTAYIST